MNTFWAVLTPFMDPKTKEKINFLKPTKTEGGKKVFEKLLEDIALDHLEEEYGGVCTFKWDYERELMREEKIEFKFPRPIPSEETKKGKSASEEKREEEK